MSRLTNVNRTTLATTIARSLVRRYPAPWRLRYEAEVLDLLDATRVRWRDVADLARGLVSERALSLFEPGDRPGATSLTFSLLPLALLACGWLGAAGAGRGLQHLVGPLPPPLARIVTLPSVVLWLRFQARFWRAAMRSNQNTSYVHWRPGLAAFPVVSPWWLVVAFTFVMFEQWTMKPPFGPGGFLALFWPLLHGVRTPVHRIGLPIHEAMLDMRRAKQQMKWARLEMQRCERLTALGVAAPLDEAHAAIIQIEATRAQALASLHAMGYRARFRRG